MLGWLLCNIYFAASNFHDMIDMKDNTMTWKKKKIYPRWCWTLRSANTIQMLKVSNRENVLECYGETRRQSSYDFFKSNFCLQNIKQHRIFRSVVLFCPLILSGSGKFIGSFHFLFTFGLKHPLHAKNTPKTTDQFLLWNIVRAWTHFF